MKSSNLVTPFAAVALVLASFTSVARADNAALVASPEEDRIEVTGPNRGLLRSGVWTLGLSYIPAVVVAVESTLPADDNLFIPVAGPWMDYATRDCPECSHETMNKVLLVTNGVVQGLGALQILGSFLFVEKRVTGPNSLPTTGATPREPAFQIAPARLAGGYGVTAKGRF